MLCVPVGKKNYQFEVTVGLEELTSVPFVNGVMFAKLRILDSRNSKQYSSRQPIQNHRVEWNSTHKFSCRLIANLQTNMLENSELKVSIRKENKSGKSYDKMGYVIVNISCFANNGSRACRRRYILDSYNQEKRRQDNSMLQMNFTVCQVFGDPCFRVPEENTSKCVPYEVLSSSGLLMTHTPHHHHHLLPDEVGDDGTGSSGGVHDDEPGGSSQGDDVLTATASATATTAIGCVPSGGIAGSPDELTQSDHPILPDTIVDDTNNNNNNNYNPLSSLESSNTLMMMMNMMNNPQDDPFPHLSINHHSHHRDLFDETLDLYSDTLLATVPKRSQRIVNQPPQNIPGYSTCPHPTSSSRPHIIPGPFARSSAGATMTQQQSTAASHQFQRQALPLKNSPPHQIQTSTSSYYQYPSTLPSNYMQTHRRYINSSNQGSSGGNSSLITNTTTSTNMTTNMPLSSSGYASSSQHHSRQSSNEFSSLSTSAIAPSNTCNTAAIVNRTAHIGTSQSLDEDFITR